MKFISNPAWRFKLNHETRTDTFELDSPSVILFMITKIPEKFSNVRHVIEKLCVSDETFRSIYEDYQTYLEALQFWELSNSDDAPARQSEYKQLAGELEEELIQILDKSESWTLRHEDFKACVFYQKKRE